MRWRLYHLFNLLSLDVALGAVASAAFFGRILHVEILPQGYILLGIVVWLIYTADHLLDAWSMKESAISERHRFHQKHFNTLLFIFGGACVVAIILMFTTRIQLITAGVVFGIFVVTYLLVNRWLKYFKELTGSLLYTGGVLLPAWSLHSLPLSQIQVLLICIFLLIVLTNMLIFARFSIEEDQRNNQKSLATVLGTGAMNVLIRIVVAVCFAGMVYTAVKTISAELVILLVMELVLVVVFEIEYFRGNDRYRAYGDAVFLLPAIVLILPPLPAAISLSLPSAR
jgi:1,4-dihydroxy-2-naphthoate octaprenyltransferase